jgi:hypothetical protein
MEKLNVHPGETVSGHIELRVLRPLRFRSISAHVWGGEHAEVMVSRGGSSREYEEEVPVINEELVLEPQGLAAALPQHGENSGTLSQGSYVYGFSFEIPPHAPFTWDYLESNQSKNNALIHSRKGSRSTGLLGWGGSKIGVRYFVRFRVDIPRNPDASMEQEIIVTPPPRKPKRRSITFTSKTQNEQATMPVLSGSLDSAEIIPGEIISGRINLTNPRGKNIRKFKLRLLERVWAKAQGHTQTMVETLSEIDLKPQNRKGSEQLSFSMKVPDDVRPSIIGRICRRRHFLEVHAYISLASDVKVRGELVIIGRD